MSATQQVATMAAIVLLGPKEVCSLIPGMTTAKLAQLRFNGVGPEYMKPTPKTVVYDRDKVLEWLHSTARTGTAVVA